jgi:transglutaminase superfamily protein
MSAIDAAAVGSAAAEPTPPAPPVPLVITSWLALAFVHLAVALTGFPRLYRLIGRWPTLGVAAASPDAARRVEDTCAAMTRARTYYFKYTWCLHSAAATVALLRLRGVPAQLVIGVRRIPFRAHAWVEVDRRIVMNNQRNLDVNYRVITRC